MPEEERATLNDIENMMRQAQSGGDLQKGGALYAEDHGGGEAGSENKKSKVIFSVKKNQQSQSNF